MLYLEDLAEELDSQFDGADTMVHKNTGEFVYLNTEYYGLAEEVDLGEKELEALRGWEQETVKEIIDYWEHSEDYLPIPDLYEINEYGIMEDFIDQLSSPIKQNQLAWAIEGRGAFRRFKDTVSELGLEQAWYRFKEEAFLEIAKNWCRENDVRYQRKGVEK